jgi:PiT family inorganic phosphate transporter
MTTLIIVLTLVLMAEFVNGWTDAPNAIATVVSTNVLPPQVAIIMAVVLNTLGALAGTAVAQTIYRGIVIPEVVTLPALAAAMITIVAWGSLAGKLGMPVSKSHALIAALAGAGVAGGGFSALLSAGWIKVAWGLGLSLVVGFSLSLVVGWLLLIVARRTRAGPAKRAFDRLQVLAAMAMAFVHGMNDGQKFMGIFALALMKGGLLGESDPIPFWVMGICASSMGLGTACGGWKIIGTIGRKMTRLTSWQGFVAQGCGASIIWIASLSGIPLSTTHTITTSIAGAAAAKRFSDVRWEIVIKIAVAWICTFPGCFLIAVSAAYVANRIW